MTTRLRRVIAEWRPSAITLGAPAFPLAVLFGLNAVDELDRAAFALLLPAIQDDFGLTNSQALALVAATTVAIVLIEIPLSFYADRGNRVRIAAVGAAVWGVFSAGTGLAVGVGMLILMRIGAGGGKAVVTPTHSSLLSDYYEPAARVKVFSAHRLASSLGQILGPLAAGLLASAMGWSVPFLIFAVPTLLLVFFATRLREPARGEHDTPLAPTHETGPPLRPRDAVRQLSRVRTIRRLWLAAPFLGIALFGIPSLLSLVYEDVFQLDVAARGAIAALIEPLQIIGVLAAMPFVARVSVDNPGFLLRFVAFVGVADAVLIVGLAFAPHVAVAVVIHAALAASIATLAPAFLALVSLVAPPRVRSVAFTTMSVAAIPGLLVLLPSLGALSDAVGVQASMLMMVPVSIAAGLILASASRFTAADATPVGGADSMTTTAHGPAPSSAVGGGHGPGRRQPSDGAPPRCLDAVPHLGRCNGSTARHLQARTLP